MYGTLVTLTKTYNFPEYCMAVNQMPFELEPATQLYDCDFWTVADDRKKAVENKNYCKLNMAGCFLLLKKAYGQFSAKTNFFFKFNFCIF